VSDVTLRGFGAKLHWTASRSSAAA
jgi:hypothetical protein